MVVLFLAATLLCAGCGSKQVNADRVKNIYYVNNNETGVGMYEYEMQADTEEAELDELIEQMGILPAKLEYKPPLKMGFRLLSYRLEDAILYLDMSEEYHNLSPTTEVLVRAALVRTLSQAAGVSYVVITVEENQLYDNLGNVVGLMTADQFIDNAGNEINAYERVSLRLYFANEDGTALIATTRTIAYNTNIPMERLVMDELLAGPGTEVADVVYPTVNPSTKVVSVSVRDGICYVDLDENFLTQIYNVSSDVTIYSIVNSLVELSGVNKVQISINGETNLLYRENTSLTTVFERNLDLITTVE
ncbi:MAG: GerMN domain-containing protein [Lachnospiraceae bacterium]|nr:GerMN domain-containing protein [Lachnospiraceae bacterium]